MIVRSVLALLLVVTLVILGLGFLRDDGQLAMWALPPLLVAAVLFVFRPQLEWAWRRRYPADLDDDLVRLLETRRPPWYARLSAADQLALRQRVALMVDGFDFRVQSQEERTMPADLAALLVAQAARLSLLTGVLIPEPFETVVVYRHPFPSPQFPEQLHHSELYAPDGVILLALPYAVPGAAESQTYFNLALYEFARAYATVLPPPSAPAPTLPPWPEAVRAVVGAEPTWVTGAIGLEEVDAPAVFVVLALDFPEAFAKTYPALRLPALS